MANLKQFAESDFEQTVLANQKPVLVDFHADWCGPCKMMGPVVDQIALDYEQQLEVGKLDVDENPGIAIRYGVMGIPTLGLFRDGNLVDTLVGFPGPAGVKAWIEKALATTARA
jgi:thioredoxin 1